MPTAMFRPTDGRPLEVAHPQVAAALPVLQAQVAREGLGPLSARRRLAAAMLAEQYRYTGPGAEGATETREEPVTRERIRAEARRARDPRPGGHSPAGIAASAGTCQRRSGLAPAAAAVGTAYRSGPRLPGVPVRPGADRRHRAACADAAHGRAGAPRAGKPPREPLMPDDPAA
jgi:hypothetical protein